MKVGLLVRGEDRGLGSLSRDWYDHLNPDKTLLVVPAGVRRHGLVTHSDWFEGATVARFDGNLDPQIVRPWLDGLDVVLSFETAYDWRICDWARAAGCATVCLAMPEWWRPQWADLPTQWWAPTTWRLEHLPASTKVVPVPMSVPETVPTGSGNGTFRWLHVGGARLPDEQIHADRNGTEALLEACRYLTAPQEVVVRTQSPGVESDLPNVTVRHESLSSRWDLYRDVDALVLPRRYAGLCLPALEAFACGLPEVMTDMSPQNEDWPVETCPTKPGIPHVLYGKQIETGDADPHALAALMDEWASTPHIVREARERATAFASQNSWEQRGPEIRLELERAANLVTA